MTTLGGNGCCRVVVVVVGAPLRGETRGSLRFTVRCPMTRFRMRSSNDFVDGDDVVGDDSNSGCKTEAAAAFFDVLDREERDDEDDLDGSLPGP